VTEVAHRGGRGRPGVVGADLHRDLVSVHAWQAASVSIPSDRALVSRASRVAILSFCAMLACGVVMGFGYVATLPAIVWILVLVVLALSIPAWAVAVFRDARATGLTVGSAIWKSVRLTWTAIWELLP
jgi:Flp pilus assembly protein TadB